MYAYICKNVLILTLWKTFRFFERIDTNHDGFITRLELKNFIMEVNYEEILMDDEIAENLNPGLQNGSKRSIM